jgi:hypothetical protein
MKFSN